MSEIKTQGNSILVDMPNASSSPKADPTTGLTSWVIEKVSRWEDQRNRGHQRLWAEYWRLWRGKWSQEDRNRLSERSRLIAPALAQAIESSVSEAEEGLFGREVWFDIADDIQDQEKTDASLARDQLREDLDLVNAKDVAAEAVLNSAIFGTGIIKINTEVRKVGTPVRDAAGGLQEKGEERVFISWESVRPDEFIPDPNGKNIQEMLGCAHRVQRPMHAVLEKISAGVYRKEALNGLHGIRPANDEMVDRNEAAQQMQISEACDIVEYHGKVPLNMLNRLESVESPLDMVLQADAARNQIGDGPMVEAIVTIANGSVLLRAMITPFVMKDRSIIAFNWEKVPGRFWGRGVAEKGYNPQKALDAEVRSRIDALGFISSPMLGVDSGRLPRGFKMEIKPGKVWLTQGPPREILQPVEIGNLNAATFNQASEMERMVQMGTGAFDTAGALGQQSQSGASGATSNSMMMGAFVKRSKRAIANLSRQMLQPALTKTMWRYMQFQPERYPQDHKFVLKAGSGIVAREVETMQLTQLMGMMPQGFEQVSIVMLKGIVDLSSVYNKAEIAQAIDAALQPPSEEEQQKQQELQDAQLAAAMAEAQQSLLDNQLIIAKIRETLANAEVKARKADSEDERTDQEDMRIQLQKQEIEQFAQQNAIAEKRLELQDKQVTARIEQMKSKPKGGGE